MRETLATHLDALGVTHTTDAKGNLLARLGLEEKPNIVVTAHMDEIAMIVRRVGYDGKLEVGALGGLFPWKIGEGPVVVMASTGYIDGALSFGSIHTADPTSTVRRADQSSIGWPDARVITGLGKRELEALGVRPGTRVAVSPERRRLTQLGSLVGGFFLDDRADLVSWLLAIEALKSLNSSVLFAATAAEEVGGEGAKFVLRDIRPDICIALELGPSVPDAPVNLSEQPTVWADDSYSAMSAADGDLLAKLGTELGLELQFQALSRGGSDASASASQGLCARPFTLGLAMENSHGFEIMHAGAMDQLARLTVALVQALST